MSNWKEYMKEKAAEKAEERYEEEREESMEDFILALIPCLICEEWTHPRLAREGLCTDCQLDELGWFRKHLGEDV